MHGRFDSRHALVGLSDEVIRLNGRLRSLFAGVGRGAGLGDSELGVLNSVVEAERAPTVSQIGRSIGQPRQLIQRAANALVEAGMIETVPNPDHKRAMLLRATSQGLAIKRELDARADAIAQSVWGGCDSDAAIAATRALHDIRKQLEGQLRAADKSAKLSED